MSSSEDNVTGIDWHDVALAGAVDPDDDAGLNDEDDTADSYDDDGLDDWEDTDDGEDWEDEWGSMDSY